MLSLVYITGYAERYREDDEETEDDTFIFTIKNIPNTLIPSNFVSL